MLVQMSESPSTVDTARCSTSGLCSTYLASMPLAVLMLVEFKLESSPTSPLWALLRGLLEMLHDTGVAVSFLQATCSCAGGGAVYHVGQ